MQINWGKTGGSGKQSVWCSMQNWVQILSVGCLVFTERKLVVAGAERVTPSSPVSTADQTMIPSGPQPGGQERDVAG